MLNANTPVIVGVSQILQRLDDPLLGKEAIDLMVDAVKMAAVDAENPKLLSELESVRVIRGVWKYKQPAKYVAEQLGLADVETVGSPFGGNMVQSVVNQSALEILRGEKSLLVITGAEIGNSLAKARKAGIELPLTPTSGSYNRMIGHEKRMASEHEMARGIQAPIQLYPMFENALRYARGESISEHIERVSELWAGFSKVASQNPNAWIQNAVDAKTIRTASATNRMISFPYPKLMNSNSAVDMASALILCSVEKAKQLGIPESKWVYPWAGTDAHDHYFVSNRDNLHSSPAIRIAGTRALSLLDMNVADIDLIDVYSCFPSAVQVAVNELKLDASKPLTVTGGLTFGGGPLNNYVMHSIARMVDLLRDSPNKKGMITANGGFLTKHAFGIYSGGAPGQDFQHEDCQSAVDATPFRECAEEYEGKLDIESYTVMYGVDGPKIAHIACLLDDGRRTWANSSDLDLIQEMTQKEFCGRSVMINRAGEFKALA